MKKPIFTLIFLVITVSTFASHMLGGSIGWRCIPDGRYIFTMEIYRDCSGIPWRFQFETIEILGNPLPTNRTSIVLKPDSSYWSQTSFGDVSPQCDTTKGGMEYSCQNGDFGSVQVFFYKSDPVTIQGTPPSTGWEFYWNAPCCRATDIENINDNGSNSLLKAIMYPGPNGRSADPCYDSSPQFTAVPEFLVCRNQKVNGAVVIRDNDTDSMVFSLSSAIRNQVAGGGTILPQPITYSSGYSYNIPTPDQNIDNRNIPYAINPENGSYQLANYSGVGKERYTIVEQIDAYRRGIKISSIFRDYPMMFMDCPDLSTGEPNKAPKIKLNGIDTTNYTVEVFAGELVEITISVNDGNSTLNQGLTLIPQGLLFSTSKANSQPCNLFGIEPCAYLNNQSPTLDQNLSPPRPTVRGADTLNTIFYWQTDCNHLSLNFYNVPERLYTFYLKTLDDHCPIPASTVATINVRVKTPLAIDAPYMIGPTVNLDGTINYQWVPPVDSAFTFARYEVEQSRVQNGQTPQLWTSVNNNESKYQQSGTTDKLRVYNLNDPINPNSGSNLFEPFTQFDWYLRMKTRSGCDDTNSSRWSEITSVMELNASPAGMPPNGLNLRSKVKLEWNPARKQDSVYPAHHIYHAQTKYYVHSNDSTSGGKVKESSRWKVIDNTYDTSIVVSSSGCRDFSAYRIEARDTVIIIQQGTGMNRKLYDTLTYSTFSIIDTIFSEFATPTVRTVGQDYLESDVYNQSYHWIDCFDNSVITGANGKVYTPTKAGEYRVLVGFGGGPSNCSDTSDCFNAPPINSSFVSINKDSLIATSNAIRLQWFDCDLNTVIVGEESSGFIPTKQGNYSLISKLYGYNDTTDCFTTKVLNDQVVLFGTDSLVSSEDSVRYQWVNCNTNSPIPGANEKTFLANDTGFYAVIVSAYGYSDTSNCIPVLAISVPEISFQETIRYYPNPTTGSLFIKSEKTHKQLAVQVRNIHGQLIEKLSYSNQQNIEFELKGESGIYFVELVNERGERANLKIIKH